MPRRKNGTDRECPSCTDGRASFNRATKIPKVHLLGTCFRDPGNGPPCSPEAMRNALSVKYGVPDECLGMFGLPKRASTVSTPPMRQDRSNPYERAAARRWWAADALPDWLSRDLHRMCMRAIRECGDDFPSADPTVLLSLDYDVFGSLARRTGIDPTYVSKLYRVWANHKIWESQEPGAQAS